MANDFVLQRAEGRLMRFGTATNLDPAADINDRVSKITDGGGGVVGYSVYNASNDSIERYDTTGRLQTLTDRNGQVQTLTYSDASTSTFIAPHGGLLIQVADTFGHQLHFTYDSAGRMATMTDPTGGVYTYAYDEASSISVTGNPGGNLTSVTYPGGQKKTYWYNEQDKTSNANLAYALTGITDENAVRYATWSYSEFGLALSSEHAGGVEQYSVNYVYPNVRSIATDPLGTERTYWFQSVLGVAKSTGITQPSNVGGTVSTVIDYDVNGNISSFTDFNGSVTHYSYDLTRNLETSRTEAYGTSNARTITTSWHSTYRLPTLISTYAGDTVSGTPLQTTSFTYDSSGNQLTKTITDPATSSSRTWTYTYNTYGRVLTSDGPRTDVSDVTTYTYYTCTTGYECGQVHTIADALSHVTTYNTYNAHGQPLTITDANGVVTTLTYDLRQRLTSRSVGSELTSFEYWPTGLLKKVTLPDGSYLSYSYDDAHRLTQIEDAEGNKVVYTLDAMGNHTAEDLYDPSNALARTHSQVFNSLSQLWKDVSAAGTSAQTTEFGYDNNGNQTTINAPLTRNTSNQYDALNRLTQVTDPASGVTQYGYDANDHLTAVTDPRGLTTSYAYNGLGDLTQLTSPDTGTTIHTYDAAGDLATRTDARSKTGTYSYDALNRVTQIAYSDQTLAFTYDAGTNGKGHLTGASDANHALAWTYDAQGRITGKGQTVGGLTKGVGYSYTNGNLTQLVTPSGQTINYGYTHGRITSLTVNGTTLLNTVLYDPFGPTRGWTWGNSTYAIRTYDTDGKATQIDSAGLHTYSYDDAFRITGLTDTGNSALSWSYDYDSLDRLTNAAQSSSSFGWTYDANGNRLSQTSSNASTFTIASASNQLDATSGTLTRTYAYDAAGNPTSDGTRTFTYNDAGRMITANNGSYTTTYTYNALGQRIKKTNASSTTYFVYDEAGHLIGEYDGTGALIQETVWFNDIPVALLLPNGSGVQTYYIHTDHLNTPRKISRQSDNAIVWRWDSDAFGNGAANEDPDGNSVPMVFNQRFPGQYYDQETGLNYNYYRDYDPSTGRYAESDPIGIEGGVGTYSYASSNPIMLIDVLGEEPRGGERGSTGGAGGKNTNNPFKHCREFDPPDPRFVQCRDHQTGQWIRKPRPPEMPFPGHKFEMCPNDIPTKFGLGTAAVGITLCALFPEVCLPVAAIGSASIIASQ